MILVIRETMGVVQDISLLFAIETGCAVSIAEGRATHRGGSSEPRHGSAMLTQS
jgi:hypothetical protein